MLFQWLSYLLVSGALFGQSQDTSLLISQAAKQLASGYATDQILSDTSLMKVHSNTSFRALIKKFTKSNTLTMVTPAEPGQRIEVTGIVKDKEGNAIPFALVYCYQTDDRGYYAEDGTHVPGIEGDRRHARLFGYLKTDASGKFELATIHPRGYPNSELPAHIHCEIAAKGYQALITELLFEDDPRLKDETRARSLKEGFVISPAIQNKYQYDLVMVRETN